MTEVIEVIRQLIRLAIDVAGHDQVQQLLDEERAAEATADAVAAKKFGPHP